MGSGRAIPHSAMCPDGCTACSFTSTSIITCVNSACERGRDVLLLPQLDSTHRLVAGDETCGSRQLAACYGETPDTRKARRGEFRLPARFRRIVGQLHLTHRLAAVVDDLIGHPVNRARLGAACKLVDHRFVLTRGCGDTVGAGGRAAPGALQLRQCRCWL